MTADINMPHLLAHFNDQVRLVELERDKLRLDWIEANLLRAPRKAYFLESSGVVHINSFSDGPIGSGADLRSAIDAAMGDKAAAAFQNF